MKQRERELAGCIRAASLACATRFFGSATSGLAFPGPDRLQLAGRGSGLGSSTTRTGRPARRRSQRARRPNKRPKR